MCVIFFLYTYFITRESCRKVPAPQRNVARGARSPVVTREWGGRRGGGASLASHSAASKGVSPPRPGAMAASSASAYSAASTSASTSASVSAPASAPASAGFAFGLANVHPCPRIAIIAASGARRGAARPESGSLLTTRRVARCAERKLRKSSAAWRRVQARCVCLCVCARRHAWRWHSIGWTGDGKPASQA